MADRLTIGGRSPRAVDHIVLPFETLVAARTFFDALGFTVAPEAAHPFGTGNACVFFADGTYLEPLATIDEVARDAACGEGNPFVRADRDFRSRHRLPAVSAIAFRSRDAIADRDDLAAKGRAAEGLLEFGRTFATPSGERRQMAFRLALAAPDPALDATAFYCQPLHAFAPDRTALTRHRNGASGLLRIVCQAFDPQGTADLVSMLGGGSIERSADEGGIAMALANCGVEILRDDALAARYGEGRTAAHASIRGLVLATDDLAVARDVLASSGLPITLRKNRCIVPLGTGSSFIAFEETSS